MKHFLFELSNKVYTCGSVVMLYLLSCIYDETLQTDILCYSGKIPSIKIGVTGVKF